MRRRIALLAPLLLMPSIAWAAAGDLGALEATTIHYAKWVFLIAGLVAVVGAARSQMRQGSDDSKLLIAVGAAFGPGIILWFWDYVMGQDATLREIPMGSTDKISKMLEQVGMLGASMITNTHFFVFLGACVLMYSLASLAIQGMAD